jgi:hypothetical protein
MFNIIDPSMWIVYLGIKPRPIRIQKMTLISNVVENIAPLSNIKLGCGKFSKLLFLNTNARKKYYGLS